MVQTAQIGRKLTRKRIRKTAEEAVFKPPMTGAQAAAQIVESGAFGAWAHRQDTANGLQIRPFYETATPEEWLAAFTEWTESHRDMPRVPVSAFSREADYEDRL